MITKEMIIKLQTNVGLPLTVIIDWQLDNKSKLHYVEQTGAFTTNNVNSIIMQTIEELMPKSYKRPYGQQKYLLDEKFYNYFVFYDFYLEYYLRILSIV